MTPDELKALVQIQGFASANRVTLRLHAQKRTRERGSTIKDVVHALAHASTCKDQRGDSDRTGDWRVTGPDIDNDELVCIVVVTDGVIVVTVF